MATVGIVEPLTPVICDCWIFRNRAAVTLPSGNGIPGPVRYGLKQCRNQLSSRARLYHLEFSLAADPGRGRNRSGDPGPVPLGGEVYDFRGLSVLQYHTRKCSCELFSGSGACLSSTVHSAKRFLFSSPGCVLGAQIFTLPTRPVSSKVPNPT